MASGQIRRFGRAEAPPAEAASLRPTLSLRSCTATEVTGRLTDGGVARWFESAEWQCDRNYSPQSQNVQARRMPCLNRVSAQDLKLRAKIYLGPSFIFVPSRVLDTQTDLEDSFLLDRETYMLFVGHLKYSIFKCEKLKVTRQRR